MFYGVAGPHHTRTFRSSSRVEIRQRWQSQSVCAAGGRVSRRSVAGPAGVPVMVWRCDGSLAQNPTRHVVSIICPAGGRTIDDGRHSGAYGSFHDRSHRRCERSYRVSHRGQRNAAMTVGEALREAWEKRGDPTCLHDVREKEFYPGSDTSAEICVACGKSFWRAN